MLPSPHSLLCTPGLVPRAPRRGTVYTPVAPLQGRCPLLCWGHDPPRYPLLANPVPFPLTQGPTFPLET